MQEVPVSEDLAEPDPEPGPDDVALKCAGTQSSTIEARCRCAMAGGVVPYLYLAIAREDWVVRVGSSFVFVNGVLYHTVHCFMGAKAFATVLLGAWDVWCNVLGLVLLNYFTAFQPETAVLTGVGLGAYVINKYNPYPYTAAAIHVVYAQGVGWYALYKF